MNIYVFIIATLSALVVRPVWAIDGQTVYTRQGQNRWFTDAVRSLQQKIADSPVKTRARNVVFFLGDGMGISTITAIRILDGQIRKIPGEENVLSWENLPYTALSKTYAVNAQVTDSASTATACLTGVKSNYGVVGLDEHANFSDCESANGHEVLSLLAYAERAGLKTGIVTTARVTHATPAAAYAHSPSRKWEASAPRGCIDIASQLVRFPHGDGIDVVLGGGLANFLNGTVVDPSLHVKTGARVDGKNLIEEWKRNGGKFISSKKELSELDPHDQTRLLGLFVGGHMSYEADRDPTTEPSLAEMTEFAIKRLKGYGRGFVLFVEGALIDSGHHDGNAHSALHDGVAFAKAVGVARGLVKREETLLVVTADHSHTFTIRGYPRRGNDILGLVEDNLKQPVIALDGKRYTTLSYGEGPGAKMEGPRNNPLQQIVLSRNYKQQSLIPMRGGTHGGEDVGIYADGPQAHLFHGVVEQNFIFHVMDYALCLTESKKQLGCPPQ